MKHTLESLLELAKTPEGVEQLRVMVAELVGKQTRFFRFYYPSHGAFDGGPLYCVDQIPTRIEAEKYRESHSHPEKVSAVEEYTDLFFVPNYTASLDAIAEVEQSLTSDQKHACKQNLQLALVFGEGPYWLVFATALQRSIAVILTLQEERA